MRAASSEGKLPLVLMAESAGYGVARFSASERLVRQTIAARRTAAPVRTPSAPTATAAASAWEGSMPDAISAAAPAPICVAAPAGPIGSAAAAAPAQRKSSASGTEKPTPRPPKSRKQATARTSQQAETSAQACAASPREVVRGPSQRPSRKRRKRFVTRQARQREDQRCGDGAGDGDDRQPRAHAPADARQNRRGQGERRQGDTVDQPEHQEREAEHAYARRAAGIATHDRDAHRVVEPAGKDDADQGRAAIARGEGERARTLVPPEQPPPAERLESLGEQQQQSRGDEQARGVRP